MRNGKRMKVKCENLIVLIRGNIHLVCTTLKRQCHELHEYRRKMLDCGKLSVHFYTVGNTVQFSDHFLSLSKTMQTQFYSVPSIVCLTEVNCFFVFPLVLHRLGNPKKNRIASFKLIKWMFIVLPFHSFEYISI